MASDSGESPERRSLVRRWIAQALAVVAALAAGAVLMAVGEGGDALFVAGLVVFGVAATAGVALVFYEIGRSEDRERAAGRH